MLQRSSKGSVLGVLVYPAVFKTAQSPNVELVLHNCGGLFAALPESRKLIDNHVFVLQQLKSSHCLAI